MAEIITNLHPDGDENTNLYPNIKKENIPSKSISTDKLDDNVLSLIGSLKPSGTDTSTNILAYTSNKGIYVATDNGHWYYWNGSVYVDGGVYQSRGIADGSVYPNSTSFFAKTENLLNIDTNNKQFILDNGNLSVTLETPNEMILTFSGENTSPDSVWAFFTLNKTITLKAGTYWSGCSNIGTRLRLKDVNGNYVWASSGYTSLGTYITLSNDFELNELSLQISGGFNAQNGIISYWITPNKETRYIPPFKIDPRYIPKFDNSSVIPSYLDNMISITEEKLYAKSTANTTSIAFITDIHLNVWMNTPDTEKTSGFVALRNSINAINKINENTKINFIVGGGDYLSNNDSVTKDHAIMGINAVHKCFNKSNIDYFLLKGNHDDNSMGSTENRLSNDILFKKLDKSNENILNLVLQYNNKRFMYGYYDLPNNKIRVLLVNTIDIPEQYSGQSNYAISNKQLNFMAQALHTPNDYGVIVFSHNVLQENNVISDAVNASNGGNALWNLLKGFKNKQVVPQQIYDYGDVSYNIPQQDYSNLVGTELICCVCGHVHDDLNVIIDNILNISTTNSCVDVGETSNVTHTPYTDTETSFDIYTINRDTKTIKITRYGAGNDREFSY